MRKPMIALFLTYLVVNVGCGNMTFTPLMDQFPCLTSPVYNGMSVDAEQSGVVYIRHDCGYCSGVLVTNNWVLTARHCYSAHLFFSMGIQSTESALILTADGTTPTMCGVPDASLDLMLVKMDKPMMMNGIYTGYKQPLFTGDPSSVTTTDAYGYGDFCELPGEIPEGGGFLRSALELRSSIINDTVVAEENSLHQLTLHGDSGGPFFFNKVTQTGKIRQLVGIYSRLGRALAVGEVNRAFATGPNAINSLTLGNIPGF